MQPTAATGSLPAAPTVPVTSQELSNQSDVIRDAAIRGYQQRELNYKHAAENTLWRRFRKRLSKQLKKVISNKKDLVIMVSLAIILFQNPKVREAISYLMDLIFRRGILAGIRWISAVREKLRAVAQDNAKHVATAALVTGQVASIGQATTLTQMSTQTATQAAQTQSPVTNTPANVPANVPATVLAPVQNAQLPVFNTPVMPVQPAHLSPVQEETPGGGVV